MDYPTGVPHNVSALFEELCFKVYEVGFDRYSARAILHQIRWHHQIDRGMRHFKCNNNWTPILARWFMKKHVDMTGFFELRNKDAKHVPGL
jgi:hypothetical protein